MASRRVCQHCGELLPERGRCQRCGISALSMARIWLTLISVVIALGLVVVGIGKWLPKSGVDSAKKVGPVAGEFEPVDRKAVLEIPGVLTAYYHDLGAQIEMRIIANGVPILYFDTDRDGKVSDNDLSYAADPQGRICVQHISANGSADCGSVASSARQESEQVNKLGCHFHHSQKGAWYK